MSDQIPAQSGRGDGFVIALFGVIILAYGLLSGYGVWKALHADDPSKIPGHHRKLLPGAAPFPSSSA